MQNGDFDLAKHLADKHTKPSVANLTRISDGFDERFSYLRLDKNEKLVPFDDIAFKQFTTSLTQEDMSGYAELGPVYKKLQETLGLNEGEIILSAGGDLAIRSVFESFIRTGDTVLMHTPTYAMYGVYCKLFGANENYVGLSDDWTVNLENLESNVVESTRIVIIENPNGSSGMKCNHDALKKLAANLLKREVLLLVDESYIHCSTGNKTSTGLINEFPNIIVIQSLTKGYGLAGLRVGYAIANKHLISKISNVRPMHEVASVSAKAALWVLDTPEMLKNYQQAIQSSTEFVKSHLERIGFTVKSTDANFFLLKYKCPTIDLRDHLFKKKILIKRAQSSGPLSGYYRVTLGDINDMRQLIVALSDI